MHLIVGGDSLVGAAAASWMHHRGDDVAVTTRRAAGGGSKVHLDLAEPIGDWTPPAGTTSACICVAVARLADCAEDPVGSARLNVTQTLALIDRLTALGVHVVFLSTNQVFDGREPLVSAEAPLCPVSEYGRQKAIVEAALRDRMEDEAPVAILRLAKVLGPRPALLANWVDALAAGRPVRAFTDMMLAPVTTESVGVAIRGLMKDRARGVYQLSGLSDLSYLEVARRIAATLGADTGLVSGTSGAEVSPPGATPRHTTMDSREISGRYGIEPQHPWEVIRPIVDEIASGRADVDEHSSRGAAADHL